MLKLNCYTHSFCKSKRKLKGLFLMQIPSLIDFQHAKKLLKKLSSEKSFKYWLPKWPTPKDNTLKHVRLYSQNSLSSFFPEVVILLTLYSLEIMEFWCKQLFQMKNFYNSVLSFTNSQQQYDIDKIDFIVT